MDLLNQPILLITVLFLLSILPMLIVMCTSFLKIAVVLSLFRNALGIQQIPPNMAIYSLALLLTFFIMAPVGMEINDNLKKNPINFSSADFLPTLEKQVIKPYYEFIEPRTNKDQIHFFGSIGKKIWPKIYHDRISEKSLLVVMPAFAVSQLIEAFKIGLLLYLPFIAIDLIVSNILLAMGMMMVSPMTISLPFKLLIFVLIGGWEKLLEQLVLSYA